MTLRELVLNGKEVNSLNNQKSSYKLKSSYEDCHLHVSIYGGNLNLDQFQRRKCADLKCLYIVKLRNML